MFDFGYPSYCLNKGVFLFMLAFLCFCECFFVCFLFVCVSFCLFFVCVSVFFLRQKEEAVSGAIEDAYHLRKRNG